MSEPEEHVTARQTTQHEDQERGFEVLGDECIKKLNIDTLSRSQNTYDAVQNISVQALQNAVETANMVAKQAVRHGDIAIDRQWNVDEQGYTVAEILKDKTFKDAIAAAVVSAVNEVVKPKE